MNGEHHITPEEEAVIFRDHKVYIDAALSEGTKDLYQTVWRIFEDFCERRGYQAFPTRSTVLLEFAAMNLNQGHNGRPLSMNTVDLYLKAINYKNIRLGFSSPYHHPFVKLVLRGMRRIHGTASKEAEALLACDIKKMIDACENSLIGKRNAAIMAIGFAAALRRSEITNLRIEDIEPVKKEHPNAPEKILLHVRKSKTDQESEGRKIPIIQGENIQPIKHLNEWLQVSGIKSGYLFQTMIKGGGIRGNRLRGRDISLLLKKHAELIGLDPDTISGHSLRAGFVTNAVKEGARDDKIMAVSRHSSRDSLSRYIRDGDCFTDHAGEGFL